jgi:hypothetical protein
MTISSTTWHILYATKQKDIEFDYDGIKSVLAPLFHENMKLDDVMSILLKSLDELIAEPRFETHYDIKNKVILAPLKTSLFNNIETVWDVYNSMILNILCEFRNARASWCLDELKNIGKVTVNGEEQ